MACEQRLEARVTLSGRNRKQSGYVEIEANDEAAQLRKRSHLAQGVKRANKMAEQKPAVDHIEIIARQASIVCAGPHKVNIAETMCLGTALRDCEFVGTDVDRGDLALRTPPGKTAGRETPGPGDRARPRGCRE
jgi:hypothetical protein